MFCISYSKDSSRLSPDNLNPFERKVVQNIVRLLVYMLPYLDLLVS